MNSDEEKKAEEIKEEEKAEENKEEETKEEETPEEEKAEPEVDEKTILEAEIKDLNEQVNRWKTDYYKVFADMENLKKRLKNEHETALKFILQEFVTDLLPVVDNLERALKAEADPAVASYLKGFEMVNSQLLEILKKHGVTEISAEGQPFDPNLHQAVMTEKVEGVESGMVLEQLQKGYMLNDRVIRATLVKVSE